MLFVTYNIQWGKGRDGKIDLARISGTVEGADIIVLQEVERHWRLQEFPDQAQRLASLLPGRDWVYGASLDLNGSLGGPRRQCGNMVLSRFPITSSRTLPLPSRAVHGHMNDHQAMTEAVIDTGSFAFRLYNLHLNYLSRLQRLAQIELVLDFVATAPSYGGVVSSPGKALPGPEDDWIVLTNGQLPAMPTPAIMMGDFNAGPGTPEYDVLAGALSPTYGRLTEAHNFADALTICGLREDEGITFPATGREPPQRLDHCFVSPDLIPSVRRAWIDNDAVGSDHQPVWMELGL